MYREYDNGCEKSNFMSIKSDASLIRYFDTLQKNSVQNLETIFFTMVENVCDTDKAN